MTISIAKPPDEKPAVVATGPPPTTVLVAFQELTSSPQFAERVDARMARMRVTAFNADRYMNALDLASSQVSLNTEVAVELPAKASPNNVVSLALALAMYKVESHGVQQDMRVLLPERCALEGSRCSAGAARGH